MHSKKGFKTIGIIGIVIGVLVVAGVISFFAATKDTVRPAFLKVNSGFVSVDNGKGYNIVTGEVALKANSKVKTGDDGHATIVLFESLIQELEPDSEVSIESLVNENPRIKESFGNTWNKFTSLTGMKSYEVKAPNSVAIVRGTGYTMEINKTMVIDGVVAVNTSDGRLFSLLAGRALVLVDGVWIERDLTPSERAYLISKLKSSVIVLKELRDYLLEQHRFIANAARSASGWSDQELKDYLSEMDDNKHDVQELYDKSPIKNAVVTRVAELTRTIQNENKLIMSLEAQ